MDQRTLSSSLGPSSGSELERSGKPAVLVCPSAAGQCAFNPGDTAGGGAASSVLSFECGGSKNLILVVRLAW